MELIKNDVLSKLLEDISVMIENAKSNMDEAQKEANSHIGAMASRYDTFKEEAQYLVAGFQKKISDLNLAKIQIEKIKWMENELGKSHSQVGIGTIIFFKTDDSQNESYFIMSPALGGHKLQFKGINITIITPFSPIGQKMMGKKIGENILLTQSGKNKYINITKLI